MSAVVEVVVVAIAVIGYVAIRVELSVIEMWPSNRSPSFASILSSYSFVFISYLLILWLRLW